jgi:uncharacterized membrane protein
MIINYLANLPKELIVIVISAIPLLELRASIPYALLMDPKLSPALALALSVFGSWLPAFFIVFLLEHIEPILRKQGMLNTFIDKVYTKTRAKSEQIKTMEFWGLVIFIAIPLPGTGVWTGALAGYLLGLSAVKIIFASLLGTLGAGILMVFLSAYIALLIRYTLLGFLVALLALGVYFVYNRFIIRNKKS